jgi:vacuolar protein sorting-associated protein IST1
MELYCELLLARFGLIELNSREPDQGVSEGICSIIHAAPRTDLKELQTLREMLVQKYGREFAQAAMENRENCVSERVMNKLRFTTPSTELVTAYCAEIARGYGVPWVADEQFTGENDDSDADGGAKEKPPVEVEASLVTAGEKPIKLPDIPPTETRPASATGKPKSPAPKAPEEDELAALTKRFEALRKK